MYRTAFILMLLWSTCVWGMDPHRIIESYIPQEQEQKQQEDFEIVQTPLMTLKEAIQNHYHAKAPEIISAYNKGREIFLKSLQQDMPTQLSKEDLRDVLWFFYIYAVATHSTSRGGFDFFEEGTFHLFGDKSSIEKLYYMFLQSKDRYDRASSHFNEQIGRWDHHGIDIDDLPPAHMKTVLFARLQDTEMYIKPEQHGTGLAGIVQHAGGYITSVAKKTLSGAARSIASYFVDMRFDDATEFRKEHLPADILNIARRIIGQLSGMTKQTIAVPNNMSKIMELLMRYQSRKDLRAQNPQLFVEIDSFIESIKKQYPDWQHRKGNEIVLNIAALKQAKPIG